MLAISTSPASAGASSSAWVTTSSMIPVVAEGSGLLFCRRLRLAGTSRLLCRLRHDFFNGGGWTEATLGHSSHRVPILFVPLVCGVG
jgi:hypothetical protein